MRANHDSDRPPLTDPLWWVPLAIAAVVAIAGLMLDRMFFH